MLFNEEILSSSSLNWLFCAPAVSDIGIMDLVQDSIPLAFVDDDWRPFFAGEGNVLPCI
jgi:hypothetical protein